MKKILSKTSFAEIILILSVICSGVFYEYLSCFLSAAMLVWLTVKAAREKKLKFNLSLTGAAAAAVAGAYLISFIWAVDRGMAVIGFLKFLPVLLYIFVLMQDEKREGIISHLPYIAAAVTVVSVAGMFIPAFSSFFSVAGRLAGTFQYPNTFALFLLVCEITVLSKEKLSALNIVTLLILLFGIFYTGSRTVFVLALVSNAVMVFALKKKPVKIALISALGTAVAGAVIYALVTGGGGAFGRLFNISFTQSTFVGRFLYFKDALPSILKHPFGTGYLGYYYTQKSYQTGVYSVMFIHNDFLQILLDVGWLPFAAFAASVVRSVAVKGRPFYQRVIICVIALHCCFDFDLQFICMFMLLVLFMGYGGKKKTIKRGSVIAVMSGVFAAVNLYTGTALLLSRAGLYGASQKMLPFNTQNEINLLTNEQDLDRAEQIADDILSRNGSVIIAYNVKAKNAYSKGVYGDVIKYKNRIFELAPFEYQEYEEYCRMLIKGIELYTAKGSEKSAAICADELIKAADAVHALPEKQSRLGKMIKDQPNTALPEEIEAYVKELKE